MRKIFCFTSTARRSRKVQKVCAVAVPSCTMKRSSPRGLTAECMFRENRDPVDATTGVSLIGAHVVPRW